MGLAGTVKLRSVLVLGGVLGLGLVGGGYWAMSPQMDSTPGGGEHHKPAVSTLVDPPAGLGAEVRAGVTLNRTLLPAQADGTSTAEAEATSGTSGTKPVTSTEATAAGAAGAGLRSVDREVLKWKHLPIPVPKKKDVSKGRAYKINVYQDDPGTGVGRAKVDLDRDDRWDEKFTFEPDGGVTRKVAPLDDENYTKTLRLTDAGWVAE